MMIINELTSITNTGGKLLHDKNHTEPWGRQGFKTNMHIFLSVCWKFVSYASSLLDKVHENQIQIELPANKDLKLNVWGISSLL